MYRKITSLVVLILLSTALSAQDDATTLLKKLTGVEAISEGKTIPDRYSQDNRLEAASYLLFESSRFNADSRIVRYSATGMNVILEIPATNDSDEWVVLGAHYDSVKDCPGANDNATGVALVYEVAQHIASLRQRNKNVYIVFFDEEEKGLIGSRNFARSLKDNNVNVHSAHTIDQMGWDQDGDRGFELEMPDDELLYLYEDVAELNNFFVPIHTTNVTSTDHKAFRELGYKAIGLTEEYKNNDTTPHYHKSTDTFDTINLEYLKSTTNYMKKVFEALLTQ